MDQLHEIQADCGQLQNDCSAGTEGHDSHAEGQPPQCSHPPSRRATGDHDSGCAEDGMRLNGAVAGQTELCNCSYCTKSWNELCRRGIDKV